MLDKAGQAGAWRRQAAEAALAEVQPGMRLGLGSGRTAEEFVRLLGERVASGLAVVAVATSERTAALAQSVGVPTTSLDIEPVLDLAVDGADEVDAELRLIKGGGGALLREKIVASAAMRFVVIADDAKLVPVLGAFPLPVEIVPFGQTATIKAIAATLGRLDLPPAVVPRLAGDQLLVTDNGNLIVDLPLGRIPAPERLALALRAIPGVVEHGLFIGIASAAIIAGAGGVRRLLRDPSAY